MQYYVIYDGDCNLCSNLVQLLEKLDQGKLFQYMTMQDHIGLEQFNITPADCEQGMILIKADQPEARWQGSNAAEEIAKLLPTGEIFIRAYRGLPMAKKMGDRLYEFIRDNRYQLFGRRKITYQSAYPCTSGKCLIPHSTDSK